MANKNTKKLVLLDSHAILHRAYHALPDFSNSKGEPTGALYGVSSMLIKIIADLKPDYIVAAYDLPKPTYRHEAYKDYKAGRAKTDPELVSQIKRSRDIFEAFSIPIYDKEGFEADDILGTIVEKIKEHNKKQKGDSDQVDIVIASGDMDTLQLVDGESVKVYTLKKGIQDTILYDEESVEKRFGFKPAFLPDYKGLRGDPSDNIVGIKGIGEKTATILIKEFGTIENMYSNFKKAGTDLKKIGLTERIVTLIKENEEEAEFSKMLATIRRDAPIDFSLPEKTWRESLDAGKVVKMFSDLEFRSLGQRLNQALLGKSEVKKDSPEKTTTKVTENIAQSQNLFSSPSSLIAAPDPFELSKLSVAFWLTNSNTTNPTFDDILNFTGAKTFDEAEKKVMDKLKELNLLSVFQDIELPLIPIVAKMKERGVSIDKDALKTLSKDYHKTLSGLEKKIWELAGEEFNVSSPKQLGVILFEKLALKAKNQKKTSGGALSTKESELEKLRDAHPIISLILEYRELSKLLGTYIDTIPDMVDKDGKLHAQFLQAGTTTGRMGCENPNLQNIPNKTELGRAIRNAFVASSGFQLVAFDYSQIELRIAAFLSDDKKLIEIFKNGEDVHTAVASEVFGVSPDKVTKDMRRKAKVINFGVMYGMGVNALRANLGEGTTREESQKFYNDYFEKFKGLASYLEDVKEVARKSGFTETYFGRRRYFPGISSKLPFIRAAAERMAINAPIQGTEADIIKLAMIRVDEFIKSNQTGKDIFLLLQVHDELVYEVRNNLVESFIEDTKKIMESIIPPEKIKGIVCRVEAKVGENWGEMEKSV